MAEGSGAAEVIDRPALGVAVEVRRKGDGWDVRIDVNFLTDGVPVVELLERAADALDELASELELAPPQG
jgi:hypothetical protein